MEKIKENLIVYTIGAIGYGIIEVLFRGFTHWSMLIAGGICFLLLYHLNERFHKTPFLLRCAYGALVITTIEFIIGIIVNKVMNLNVWDYSDLSFNLFGQISLFFTILWFLLCIPTMFLSEFVKRGFGRMRQHSNG